MIPNDWDREEQSVLEPLAEEVRELRNRHAGDPTLEVLRAAAADALPPGANASIAEHLAASRWSRVLVEGANDSGGGLTADEETRLLERITHGGRASRVRIVWPRRVRWSLLAAAGVAAIAIVAVERAGQPVPQPSAGETKGGVVNSAPAPPAARFALPLDAPAVKLSPRAFAFRGEVAGTDFAAQLRPALDAFRQGDYQRANDELDTLAPKYPQTVEISFYQGVARLFLNDFRGADTRLAAAAQIDRSADASFASDISWYRAIVDERLGRLSESRAKLVALCKESNPRQTAACEAVDQLK